VSLVPQPDVFLYLLIVITCILIALVIVRPSITASREGKMLAFVGFLVLPVFCGFWGGSDHFERSKQTNFCLSCHIMEPWGRSLHVDDPAHIAAAHFQNHRVPPDEACYTCHTDYALYGTMRTKLHGLRHVYMYYIGTPMQPIHLYSPYNNRECLHCHLGSRSFEDPTHVAMMDDLKSNNLSCISAGCHDTVHKTDTLDQFKSWSSQQ
jgi:cytochrome c-type protein NapC